MLIFFINDNLINTLNPIISIKNHDFKSLFVNGAGYGTLLELFSKKTIILFEQIKNYFACSNSENPCYDIKKDLF